MSEGPILLGHAGDDLLALDLDRLVGSHLGIVANAGGGKSGLIRRLLEQTHGRIQHIVLDIEDEFYSLREKYDYVIAGGDGDAPATVDNAAALARGALEHGFSLICQLNDLGGEGAREFVDAFLSAMLSAPRDLWRPCLIVIDETQRFDPDSIRMLTERGRKRGFTAVLASQRLPKIDANIRGDLNNWIMGRVGQSLDRRIMADQLGMSKSGERDLANIQPRHFWAMGPALSPDPVLFEVADVETTMVRPGQAKVATPPAPEALREILAGLAAQKDISAEIGNMPSEWSERYRRLAEEAGVTAARLVEIEAEAERWEGRLTELEAERDRLHGVIAGYQRAFEAQAAILADISWPSVPRKDGTMPHEPLVIPPVVPAREVPQAAVAANAPRRSPVGDEAGLKGPHRQLLAAIAWWARMGHNAPTRAQVAAIAGWRITSGHLKNVAGSLKSRGLVDYPEQGRLTLTQAGQSAAPTPDMSLSYHDQLRSTLSGPQRAVFDHLLKAGEQSREQIAAALGWEATSGHIKNVVGSLKTLDIVFYPDAGRVAISQWVLE